jgi:hypothetical protein
MFCQQRSICARRIFAEGGRTKKMSGYLNVFRQVTTCNGPTETPNDNGQPSVVFPSPILFQFQICVRTLLVQSSVQYLWALSSTFQLYDRIRRIAFFFKVKK